MEIDLWDEQSPKGVCLIVTAAIAPAPSLAPKAGKHLLFGVLGLVTNWATA